MLDNDLQAIGIDLFAGEESIGKRMNLCDFSFMCRVYS